MWARLSASTSRNRPGGQRPCRSRASHSQYSSLQSLLVVPDRIVRGHFVIKPADPGRMDGWVEERSVVHPLTAELISAIIPPRRRKVP